GWSGCGKTTLMNLISGLITPDAGSITVDGRRLDSLPLAERQRFRLRRIGLVPQNFELLDYLTVEENILLPYRLGVEPRSGELVSLRCRELATRAGIGAHLGRYPDQLSQGERQRAALCRGLVTSPMILLADEPTGNLDPDNQDRIVELLLEEARRLGAVVLMITHDPVLLPRFDRVVDVLALRKGGRE
ncbi:MAG: ATP-binding cassette domain-containing protein, partial [Verrucomicrobiae bacterium]|nr:ATP-binding cassette domain-containing protein [Verrucomicrobiae bacterium]